MKIYYSDEKTKSFTGATVQADQCRLKVERLIHTTLPLFLCMSPSPSLSLHIVYIYHTSPFSIVPPLELGETVPW